MIEAKRNPCNVRLDLIPPEVLLEVSKVFAIGAERYGDYNWQASRMTGEKGPVNHALKHILNYHAGIPDEDGPDLKIHLTHAIVNLMFEYWYEVNKPKDAVKEQFGGQSKMKKNSLPKELRENELFIEVYTNGLVEIQDITKHLVLLEAIKEEQNVYVEVSHDEFDLLVRLCHCLGIPIGGMSINWKKHAHYYFYFGAVEGTYCLSHVVRDALAFEIYKVYSMSHGCLVWKE